MRDWLPCRFDGCTHGTAPEQANVNAREVVAVRLSATGIGVIDRMAAAAGFTRSQMIRELLSEHLAEAKFAQWWPKRS